MKRKIPLVKQELKSDLHEEFGQEFDEGSLTAQAAGTKVKSLVALGEEMLMNDLKKEKMK